MKKTQTQQDMSTTIGRKQLKTAITNQKEILREKCFSRIKNKRKHILEQLRNVQNQCALSEEERDYFLERKYPSFGNLVPRDVASRNAKYVCDEGRGVNETGEAVPSSLQTAIPRTESLSGLLPLWRR